MLLLKCKMCGGDLAPEPSGASYRCIHCGTLQIPFDDGSGKQPGSSPETDGNRIAATLTHRGNMALEDKNYAAAIKFYERALDASPEYAQAYLGIFLAKRCVPSLAALSNAVVDYSGDNSFKRAMQFADEDLAKALKHALAINEQNESRQVFQKLAILLRKVVSQKELEVELAKRKHDAERRAKAARDYRNACDAREARVAQEVERATGEIRARYEPQLAQARGMNGEDLFAIMRNKANLQMRLNELKRRESSLGLFDSAQKKQLREQISVIQKQLGQVEHQEKQINASKAAKIQEIEKLQDGEIAAAIAKAQSRHPPPRREDFL